MNIFKIEYNWYEEDHEETLLGKEVSPEEFEKDLLQAKEFAESLIGIEINEGEYLGKGYRVDCLPEYYEQIIWFLIQKLGYIECCYNNTINYDVNDSSHKKIDIIKLERKTEHHTLTPP